MNFFSKMKGGGQSPPKVNASEIAWSWLGAFCGIAPVAFFNYNLFIGMDLAFIISSFGSSGEQSLQYKKISRILVLSG